MTRQLTIHHFAVDEDIKPFLSNPLVNNKTQSTSQQCSMSVRQNWLQFRDVQSLKNDIVGRLCKIRVVDKPKIGRAFSPDESNLREEVIESCHFLYHSANKRLLIQQNNAVSNNPTAQMGKLLVHLFPNELSEGLRMLPLSHDDILKLLKQKRGAINRVQFRTTGEQRKNIQMLRKTDVDIAETFLEDTAYKALNLDFKLELGGLKISLLGKWFDWVKSRKVEDIACYAEGDLRPIWLSEYLKFDRIDVQVDQDGHLVTPDVFQQLQSIEIS